MRGPKKKARVKCVAANTAGARGLGEWDPEQGVDLIWQDVNDWTSLLVEVPQMRQNAHGLSGDPKPYEMADMLKGPKPPNN